MPPAKRRRKHHRAGGATAECKDRRGDQQVLSAPRVIGDCDNLVSLGGSVGTDGDGARSETILESSVNVLQESHSAGSSSSLLEGLVVPSRVLSGLGIRISTTSASSRLNVESLLAASLAQAVHLGVPLTKALSSFSLNLFGHSSLPSLVSQVYINWNQSQLMIWP